MRHGAFFVESACLADKIIDKDKRIHFAFNECDMFTSCIDSKGFIASLIL